MHYVKDQLNDRQHDLLVKIAHERPELVPLYKNASVDDADALPSSSFADSSGRLFPIHTRQQAVLSKLYAEKQASAVHPSVHQNIDTALGLYGYDPDSFKAPRYKVASSTSEPQYLLPQYKRLSVRDADDVQPAANALFSQRRRLKVATLTQASTQLVKIAAQYNMYADELPEDTYKYAGMTTCDAGVLLDWVEARASACADPDDQAVFDKIAMAITNNFPRDGILRDRDDLVKMATLIENADHATGISHRYGTTLPDPLQTVFNMAKVASQEVDLGGTRVGLQELLSVPSEVFEEILGPGVMDEVVGPDGQIDPAQFQALLQTLPADLKTLLASTLGPHLGHKKTANVFGRIAAKGRKMIGKSRPYDDFLTSKLVRGDYAKPDDVAGRLAGMWKKDKSLTKNDLYNIQEYRDIFKGSPHVKNKIPVGTEGMKPFEQAEEYARQEMARGQGKAVSHMGAPGDDLYGRLSADKATLDSGMRYAEGAGQRGEAAAQQAQHAAFAEADQIARANAAAGKNMQFEDAQRILSKDRRTGLGTQGHHERFVEDNSGRLYR